MGLLLLGKSFELMEVQRCDGARHGWADASSVDVAIV